MSRFGFSGGDAHAAWLATTIEEPLDPDLPIVDAHHHLWMRDGAPYLFPELLHDLETGHRIVATVFAECHSMYRDEGPEALRPVGETEFVAGIAAMSESGGFGSTRACRAMFGAVDPGLGAEAELVLEAHIAAGGGRFRGIRMSTCWHEDKRLHRAVDRPGVLVDPDSLEVYAALGRLGLSLDAWVYHTQLDEVRVVADAFPELPIILNHFGTPVLGGPFRETRDGVLLDWSVSMRALAERPNITLKLGALPIRLGGSMVDRSRAPGSEEIERAWRPWFDVAMETFGADRSMFESNFPVHKNWCSYPVFWNACKRLASGASEAELRALFAGTAIRAYRIEGVSAER